VKYCISKQFEQAEQIFASKHLSHAEVADTLLYFRDKGFKPDQLQKLTGFKSYKVRHYLRLSKNLIPEVKALLHQNQINFSMARVIASVSPNEQVSAVRSAMINATSVHKFRHKLSDPQRGFHTEDNRYFEQLSAKISDKTGLSVQVKPDKNNKHSGSLSLRYADLTDFDSICTKLGFDLSEL